MSQAKVYGKITRIEELDDGTVYVEGVASTEERDAQPSSLTKYGKGQIIRSSAMKAAIPDYMRWGNVREMHQPIAAGKAAWMEVRDDSNTYMGARIVDAGSIAKVKARVLQAFSVNGQVTQRNAEDPSIIEGLRLKEISLVDAPGDEGVQRFSVVRMDEGATVDPTKTDAAPAPAAAPVAADTPATTATPVVAALPPATQAVAAATAPAAETKPGPRDELKRFMGSETWDAQMALDALKIIQSLMFQESADSGEPPEQMVDLKTAFEKLKAFVQSELGEGSASDVVAAAKETGEVSRAVTTPPVVPAVSAAVVPAPAPDQITRLAELEKKLPELEDVVSRAGEALKKVSDERDAVSRALEEITAKLDAAKADMQRKGILRVVPVEKAQDGITRAAESPAPTDTHGLIMQAHKHPLTFR